MKNENTRNTIIFIVCSVLIMGIYYFAVLRPQAERRALSSAGSDPGRPAGLALSGAGQASGWSRGGSSAAGT